MTESEGKTLAERYCSGAEHCCQEVRQMLERHKAENADIERIIRHLIKEGYIDESRYAAAFVHDKVRFAKWGRVPSGGGLRLPRLYGRNASLRVWPMRLCPVLTRMSI